MKISLLGRITQYNGTEYLLRNALMGIFIGLHCKNTTLFVYVNVIIIMYWLGTDNCIFSIMLSTL